MIASNSWIRALSVTAFLMGASLHAADKYPEHYQFTNKETWEVPDATLPPGQYILSVHDKLLDREIFQVRGAKDGKVYSNFLAIPAKGGGDPKSVLRFWPTNGDVKPMRGWFVSSDAEAWEFVYPKERAVELAKGSGSAIPAVDLSSVPKPTNNLLSPDDLHSVQLWLLTPKRVGPGSEGVQIAAAKIGPRKLPVHTTSAAGDETHKMPRTASHFLESILGGLLLIACGFLALRPRLHRNAV